VLYIVARFEARKIWRHPALIVATAITAYELYRQVQWTNAPVLNRDSYTSAWPMIIFAAGVYLAIGTTVNRRHGAESDETFDALPVAPMTRTLGTGLAFVSPLLVAIAMQGAVLVARALGGSVTAIVWAEVLVGPVTVALGAAAGMAVGWAFKNAIAVPLAGLGFVGLTLMVWWQDFMFGPYTPWLAPVPALDRNQYAFEQGYRPSTIHLVYLVLLTMFFVAVAMSWRRKGREQILAIATSLLILGGVIWAGSAQLAGLTPAEEVDWEAQYLAKGGDYVCEQRANVTYCPYQGYEGWVDEWAGEVESVLALAPAQATQRPLEIRQQIPYFVDDDEELPPAGDLTAGMWWSRGPYDSYLVAHRLGMALGVAGWAVGLPTHQFPIKSEVVEGELVARPFDPNTDDAAEVQLRACSSDGQGRAVVALWYATQSSPESREALEFQVSGERFGHLSPQDNTAIDIGYRQPSSAVVYFRREAQVALELSRLPASEVGATFEARWDQATDPTTTTTEDVAAWFGVDVPGMGDADDSWTIPCP
jgi:hypothetical protein